MKIGEKISVNTHFDFLNELLNKDYKGWMKCTYPFDTDFDIWFITLDGRESKEGWTNTKVNEDLIIEEYTGKQSERIESHKETVFPRTRAIFDIMKNKNSREYVFLGIFKLDYENATNDKRVWKKDKELIIFNF